MDITLIATTTEELEKKGKNFRGAYKNLSDYNSEEDLLLDVVETLRVMSISGDTPALVLPVCIDADGKTHKNPKL